MKSGLVVLAPGKSVGKHSTGQNEELLIVLQGQGEMCFKDGSKLPVKANSALYCPPETDTTSRTQEPAGCVMYMWWLGRCSPGAHS